MSEPTGITDKTSFLIDVIFTNSPDRIVCSGVGISDHSLVYAHRKVCFKQPNRGHTMVIYRKLKNFSSINLRYDISLQDWDKIEQHDNPNVMWAVWKVMFLYCVDKHAPMRTKRARAPWINLVLKKLMHEKDVLKLKAFRSIGLIGLNFRSIEIVNNQIKVVKQAFYNKAFQENESNIRNTWRVMN